MHGHIQKGCVVVVDAKFASCLGLGHEVRKAEQEVGEHNCSHFVERFDVVGKVGLERLEPLKVDAHTKRQEVLDCQLYPKILSEDKDSYDEGNTSHVKHDWPNT